MNNELDFIEDKEIIKVKRKKKKKQITEGLLSRTLKDLKNLYYLKLQVMPMSFNKMPGDFLIISNKHNYLVECKEVLSINNIKTKFDFHRLTQEQGLINFENKFKHQASYILLNFRDKNLKESEIYLIPLINYLIVKKKIKKKSINRKEAKDWYNHFKLDILKGSKIDISKVLI